MAANTMGTSAWQTRPSDRTLGTSDFGRTMGTSDFGAPRAVAQGPMATDFGPSTYVGQAPAQTRAPGTDETQHVSSHEGPGETAPLLAEEARANPMATGQGPGARPMYTVPDKSAKKRSFRYVEEVLKGVSVIHVPWLSFVIVTFLYITVYHLSPIILMLCLFVKCLLLFVQLTGAWSAGNAHRIFLFSMMVVAVVAGAFCGNYNYETNLENYWNLALKQEYTNVLPDESAKSHVDASLLIFSPDAKVDVTRPTMFVAGETYCVAPVVSSVELTQAKIQYWAVGKDCCDSRQGFACDGAGNPGAHAGIVLHGGDDPWDRDAQNYAAATRMAAESLSLTSAEGALFVRWVGDVEEALNGYLSAAWVTWAYQIGICYAIFFGLGVVTLLCLIFEPMKAESLEVTAKAWIHRHDQPSA